MATTLQVPPPHILTHCSHLDSTLGKIFKKSEEKNPNHSEPLSGHLLIYLVYFCFVYVYKNFLSLLGPFIDGLIMLSHYEKSQLYVLVANGLRKFLFIDR